MIRLSAVVGFSSERTEQLQECLNSPQKHKSLKAVALVDYVSGLSLGVPVKKNL